MCSVENSVFTPSLLDFFFLVLFLFWSSSRWGKVELS